MKRLLVAILLLFLPVMAVPAMAQDWEDPTEEDDKLLASDGAAEDRFGDATAIHGDVLVGGARDEDELGTSAGAAYVFRYDSDEAEWTEEQKLTASDGEASDHFGDSVAVFEGVIVVGSPRDGDDGFFSGSAYVFCYDSDAEEWLEEQKLTAGDANTWDWFGSVVAIDGDVILVGATFDDDLDTTAGSAYVFRYDDDDEEWVEEQKLTASDGGFGHFFSMSASISGDVLVIGAPGFDDDAYEAGAAYVFRYDGDEWLEEQKLTDDDPVESDWFGFSVSISGDVVVVGKPRDDGEAEDAGAAHVYRYDDGDEEWLQEQKLTASDAVEDDFIGYSVATSGGAIVTGSRRESGVDSAAYVFVFDDDDEEWIEAQKLVPSGETGFFGYSVATSAEDIIVGAYGDTDNGDTAGAIYVFQQATFLRGDVNGDGSVSILVDVLALLEWFFADAVVPPCLDAADIDDDGAVSALIDAIALMQYGFTGGDEPPAPGIDECGLDPTADDISCNTTPEDCP